MSVVTESINQFLDWALAVVTILIIYYVVKFFIIKKPSGEEQAEAERGREKLKKFIGEKRKSFKAKKEKEEIRKKLAPVKGLLVNCINASEEGVTHLKGRTKEEAGKAREQLEKFNKNIKIAWRELRKLRDKAEGEKGAALEKLAVHAHQLVNTIKEKKLLDYKVNKLLEKKNIEEISLYLQRFRLVCGVIIKGLDSLMK